MTTKLVGTISDPSRLAALVDEIESQRETIRDLLAALDDMIAELHTLRARVAEMERDARLGAVVQKRIGGRDA